MGPAEPTIRTGCPVICTEMSLGAAGRRAACFTEAVPAERAMISVRDQVILAADAGRFPRVGSVTAAVLREVVEA
jgi:DeoR/GlpR family transcriptional regulator of sugar metabolism